MVPTLHALFPAQTQRHTQTKWRTVVGVDASSDTGTALVTFGHSEKFTFTTSSVRTINRGLHAEHCRFGPPLPERPSNYGADKRCKQQSQHSTQHGEPHGIQNAAGILRCHTNLGSPAYSRLTMYVRTTHAERSEDRTSSIRQVAQRMYICTSKEQGCCDGFIRYHTCPTTGVRLSGHT